MKIGFFEKWNEKAKMIERSSLNLQMLIGLFTAIGIVAYVLIWGTKIPIWAVISLVTTFLVYSVTPKMLAKMKNKE